MGSLTPLDMPQNDFAYFASIWGQAFGALFLSERCSVDEMRNSGNGNYRYTVYPYHDLARPKNRIQLYHFGGRLHYVSDQSAAIHSNMVFAIKGQRYHLEHWLEETWRVTGHHGRAEHLCLLALYHDPRGFGLVNLDKQKSRGAALTLLYEDSFPARKEACRKVLSFLLRQTLRSSPMA